MGTEKTAKIKYRRKHNKKGSKVEALSNAQKIAFAPFTFQAVASMLDFGILIQPIDLSKYDHIALPDKDIWGVIMRKDSPLALKKEIVLEDLVDVPLIASRQMSRKYSAASGFLDWFGEKFDDLNIAATYNLVYNAAILVKAGIGYAITLDKLANTSDESNLCFRPLKPKLQSGLDIVWKKYQVFSPAAKIFLDMMQQKFG